MKRKGFIKTGLIAVAAGASGSGAFGEILVPMGENISQVEMENFTREMDLSMDLTSNSGGNYLKNLFHLSPTETEQNFFRSSLRTLLLIGNFGSLPIKGQVHPSMQQRMHYSTPEINYSVSTSLDILREMSDESKDRIRSAFSDDPDLGDRILENLDLEAKSIGVPSARRRQMKVMGSRIVSRLRHSPEMLIDEYVTKADKLLIACNSDDALEHLLKAQMGETTYANSRNQAESAALEWKRLSIPDIPVGYIPLITEQGYNEPFKEQASLEHRKGLVLLGVGVVVTGAGWLIVSTAQSIFGLVLGITIGPILILIALIVLIVKAIQKGKAKE